jgi:pimeloyl-ACP methyl ester carboxylesterase
MATVELDAGEFYYADFGDRAAMPLVLLHGMPRDHSTWAQLAPDLATLGYRVIAPDLRGHGASARTSTYSLEQMREGWADLPAITAPALVIGGGPTSPVPQHLLAKAAELIPGATLVTIEGAGHAVHQTRPREFLAAVRPFLRRILTARAGSRP